MKTRYVIAPIVILAVLIAFSAPAMGACWGEVETRAEGTITNGLYIAVAVRVHGQSHCLREMWNGHVRTGIAGVHALRVKRQLLLMEVVCNNR